MQSTTPAAQPVIRTYKGRDRRAAEDAYRIDTRQAATSGWVPVAHRWTSGWDGHELAVVFEQRPAPSVATAPVTSTRQAAGSGLATGSMAAAEPVAAMPSPPAETGAVPPAAMAMPAAVELASGAAPGETIPGETIPGETIPAPGAPSAPAPSAGTVLTAAPTGDQAPPSTSTQWAAPAAAAAVITPAPGAPPSSPSESRDVHPPAPDAITASRAHARALLECLDLHCAGEPLRLIRAGYPQVPFAPILERRRWISQHADWARRALMYEPRGHRDMYGAVLLPPYLPDADVAVLFMHNEGYSTMCGHGIIALTAGLIEERLYPVTEPQTTIRFETPAGIVTATAEVAMGAHGGHEVSEVRFLNVPSYRHATNLIVRPDGLDPRGDALFRGGFRVDIAFGGAYYGIVDAADLGLRVVPSQIEALTRAGAAITEMLRRDHRPTHPTDPDLGFVYGTIIVDGDPATSPDGMARDATLRNVTVFAEAEVDRSPCGSGTSAHLLAHLHAQRRVAIGQDIVNASITGESFDARVESETTLGDQPAVLTSVAGIGYVTGHHTFVIDDRDPLGDGFLLR